MEQPSYRLAVQVCNATSDKLQRHVCQYFTDVIVDRAREEEYDEVQTAHDLIQQLNRACPSLLHNVVPQLEEELRVEEVQLRTMATQTLGEMFSDKHGHDLVVKYQSTWNHWLGRKNDKSVAIRATWVGTMKGIVTNLTQMHEATEAALASKLLDPDDKIRAAVCKLYGELDYETALHHVSVDQLKAVAGRGLDKKVGLFVEPLWATANMSHIGKREGRSIQSSREAVQPGIPRNASTRTPLHVTILTCPSENNDPAAIAHFAWIPKTLLHNAAVSRDLR